jgi:hypothetical protein
MLIYNWKNARNNYCNCKRCNGGNPVFLPEVGQEVFSTGKVYEPDHDWAYTLFLTKNRERGVYVLGYYKADFGFEGVNPVFFT